MVIDRVSENHSFNARNVVPECDPSTQTCVKQDESCFVYGGCSGNTDSSQGIWNALFLIPLVLRGVGSGGDSGVSYIPSILIELNTLEGNAGMTDLERLAAEYLKEGRAEEGAAKFRHLANNYEAGGSYGLASKSLELAIKLFGAAGNGSGAGDTKVRLGRLVLMAVEDPSLWENMKAGLTERLSRVDVHPTNYFVGDPMLALMNIIEDARGAGLPEGKDVQNQIIHYFMRDPYDHKSLADMSPEYSGKLAYLHEFVASRMSDESERKSGVARSAELYIDAAEKLKNDGHVGQANYFNWRAEQILFKLKDYGKLFDAVLSDWQMWKQSGNEAEAAKTIIRGWHYFCESVLDTYVLRALSHEMPELQEYDVLNQERIAGKIADRIRDGFADFKDALKWIASGYMPVSGEKFIRSIGATAMQLMVAQPDSALTPDKLALSLLGGNSDVRPSVACDLPLIDMKGVAAMKLPESLEKAAERVRQARERVDVQLKGGKL